MKAFFDDGTFTEDLDKLVASSGRWNKPLIVLPLERDVKNVHSKYDEKFTFISYDYFFSKKWIADDEYDHIDFFRVDQFLINKSYGVNCGALTIKRTIKKKEEK